MSVRVYQAEVTVPAGTTQAAPVTQAITLEDNTLDVMRLIVPNGHNGLTGIALLWGNAPWFPYGAGEFIQSNDELIDYPYGEEITENALVAVAFNNDVYDHKFLLRFNISDKVTQSVVTIDSPQLSGAPAAQTLAAVQNLSGVVQLPGAAADDLAALTAASGGA